MISFKTIEINELPILEIFPSDREFKALPTIIFYHGWTSQKESAMINGYELAKRGFRILLPDSYLHGERKSDSTAIQNDIEFWDVVIHNLRELAPLIEAYQAKGLVDENRIGVAGLSMGGITTSAALTQHPWIKAAAVLMGSPSPILFSKWLLDSKWAKETTTNLSEEKVDEITAPLESISLNSMPEKIAEKPLYFWHGTEDDLVPYALTKSFYDKIKHEEYAKNVYLQTTVGGTHKVPYTVSVEMASFFEKVL